MVEKNSLEYFLSYLTSNQQFKIIENNKEIFKGNKYDLKESLSLDKFNEIKIKHVYMMDYLKEDVYVFTLK